MLVFGRLNPFRVGEIGAFTQGSAMRATLGFATESRWDSIQLVSMVGLDLSLPLWISGKRQIFGIRPKLNSCLELSRHRANQNAVLVLKSEPFPFQG